MRNPTKAYKRLGIVGAAAVVGLVPIGMFAGTASAVTAGSATLAVTPATNGATSVLTNTFTTNETLPSGDTITIDSLASAGSPIALPSTSADYTAVVGSATTNVITSTSESGDVATLTTNATIASGSTVTVTITGATNPSNATVYLSDTTEADAGINPAVNTPVVGIGPATVAAASVASVNPSAYTTTGQDFTVTGSDFGTVTAGAASGGAVTTYPSPIVYFVPNGSAAPTAAQVASAVSTTTGDPGDIANTSPAPDSLPATSVVGTSSELQGTSPSGLTPDLAYNVVVYNYNTTTTSYTTASTTSAASLVSTGTNLNFVPESGIRAVNSETGLALPKNAIASGATEEFATSNLQTSLAVPTNLPTSGYATVNVTAVGPTGDGNLQVWSSSSSTCTAPLTSVVNFQAPQDTSNSTILDLGDGYVCVKDNGASVNVLMDVTGYATSAYTVNGTRILDTRPATQTGGLQGALEGDTVYQDYVGTGYAGDTLAFNVTAVDPTADGNLRVFPGPGTGAPATSAQVPTTSAVTYIPGTDASALDFTTVDAKGYIDLYSAGTGTVNVVIDFPGYFTIGSSVQPIQTPYRLYDSRPGGIASGATVSVTAAPSGVGSSFIPGGALGVAGTIGDINPAAQGNLRTFPGGGAVPGTSTINNFPGQTRSTGAVVALNPSTGQFSIYSAGSSTNSTFDASAYVSATLPASV